MAVHTEAHTETRPQTASPPARSWPLRRDLTVALVGAAMTGLVAFLGMLWAYGSPQPSVLATPDEATNLLAARLVAERGVPAYLPPIDDPEDLLHIRVWYSNGEDARPAYPPFMYYTYGLAAKLGPIGEWLPFLVSSVGFAALAAAGALAIPRRPLLGVLLPFVAFPVGVWLTRPWMNLAFFYAVIAVAALCLVLWTRNRQYRFFAAAAVVIAVAGAARPDQLLYAYGGLYLLALLIEPRAWPRITATLFASGTAAVVMIAMLNWAVVGDPLQSGYEALSESGESARALDSLPGGLRAALYAIAPWGFDVGADFWRTLAKYWVLMASVSLLSALGMLGYAGLLRERGNRRLLLVALGALVLVFIASRYCAGCFGTEDPIVSVRHSVPRYMGMAYLLFGFAALLFVSRKPTRFATGAVVVLALSGTLVVASNLRVERSLASSLGEEAAELNHYLPEGTVVYAWSGDKLLWDEDGLVVATMPIGLKTPPLHKMDEPARTAPAASYDRVVRSVRATRAQGRPAAIAGMHTDHFDVLAARLREAGFRLVPVRQLANTSLVWEIPGSASAHALD